MTKGTTNKKLIDINANSEDKLEILKRNLMSIAYATGMTMAWKYWFLMILLNIVMCYGLKISKISLFE